MDGVTRGYLWSLRHVLRFRRSMLLVTLSFIGLTVWLYMIVPKGFFPDQDAGLIIGTAQAAPDTSFQAMQQLQEKAVAS